MREINTEAERKFENEKALGGESRVKQDKFYWATALGDEDHKRTIIESIANKVILEIGCASGRDAKLYSEYAEYYTGLDISDEAIKNCDNMGLENATFICTDGHKIPLNDKAFDCVIVNSLLHHLDLEVSLVEISRVLKDGGKLIFKEPLGTNPFFQLYRSFTQSARTADERPFTFMDLKLLQSNFELRQVRWFGFTNILAAFFRISILRQVLTNLDSLLSHTPLKYFFWQFAGVATKKSNT